MGDFGLATTAKVYRDVTRKAHTRTSLAHRIAKALDAVGMVFQLGASTYNVLDPANEEFVVGSSAARPCHFFFAFPDDSVFYLNNAQNGLQRFRPVLMINTSLHYTGLDSNSNKNYLMFFVGFVPDLPVWDATVFYSIDRISGAIANYWDQNANLYNDSACYIYQAGWQNTSQGTSTVDVRHVVATLSTAGLYLGVGSQSDPILTTDILSCLFMYAGSRIPNRALSPVNDTYLNRMCPVTFFNFQNRSALPWNTPGTQYITLVYNAVQGPDPSYDSFYDGSSAVYGYWRGQETADFVFPLANLDRTARPRRSPRADISGNARNVLIPGLIACEYEVQTSSRGPVYQNYLAPTETNGTWEQAWYAPGFRTTDPTAPNHTIVTDPDTSKQWYIAPIGWLSGCGACMDVTGYGSIITTAPSRAYESYTTFDLDFSALSLTFTGDATPWQAVGGGVPFEFQLTRTGGSNWAQVASQNYLEATIAGGATATHFLGLAVRPAPGYDMRWEYELQASRSIVLASGTSSSSYRVELQHGRMDGPTGAGFAVTSSVNATTGGSLSGLYAASGYARSLSPNMIAVFGNQKPGVSLTVRDSDTVTTPGAARGAQLLLVPIIRASTVGGLLTARVGNFSVRARRYV